MALGAVAKFTEGWESRNWIRLAVFILAVLGSSCTEDPEEFESVSLGRYHHLVGVKDRNENDLGVLSEEYTFGPGQAFSVSITLNAKKIYCEKNGKWKQSGNYMQFTNQQSHCVMDTLGNLAPWSNVPDAKCELRNVSDSVFEMHLVRSDSALATFSNLINGWTIFNRILR